MISVLSPLFLFGIAVIAVSAHVLLQTEDCEYYYHVRWFVPDDLKMADTFVIGKGYTKTCTTVWETAEEIVPYYDVGQAVNLTCPRIGALSEDVFKKIGSTPVKKSVKCEVRGHPLSAGG